MSENGIYTMCISSLVIAILCTVPTFVKYARKMEKMRHVVLLAVKYFLSIAVTCWFWFYVFIPFSIMMLTPISR